MPSVSYRICATHGEALHRSGGLCCHCHPATIADPKPAVRTRRKPSRGGMQGRPRSLDLTDRERQVASMIAQGIYHAEIPGLLGIRRNTVESLLRSGMQRIGAANTAELVAHVMKGTRS